MSLKPSAAALQCAKEIHQQTAMIFHPDLPIWYNEARIIERYLRQAVEAENKRCVAILNENVSSLGNSQWNVCVRDMVKLISAKGASHADA